MSVDCEVDTKFVCIIYTDFVLQKMNLFLLVSVCYWGDPDADGRIMLRGIFRKWEGIVGTGWSGLRIGTGGGHL
jgi:hypothetical protein